MPVFGLLLFIFLFATPFGEWFVLDFLLNNPIWILFWVPFLVFIFRFCFYDSFQEKVLKIRIKSLINPKNKFGRFVVNVLFILLWLTIWLFFSEIYDWQYIHYDEEFFRFCLVYLLLFAPMFFYTRFLWYEKSRKRIFFGLFDKLKFKLKQFNTEVFNTTSNADELKKYADLRDKGIITQKEFQAKKKKLLDL